MTFPTPRLTRKYFSAVIQLLILEGLSLDTYYRVTFERGRSYLYTCLRFSYGYEWDKVQKEWVFRGGQSLAVTF